MEIAQYVALCTRLSRFVQLQTLTDEDARAIRATCSDLTAFYLREEEDQQQKQLTNRNSVFGGNVPSSATMDDIMLLTMQKLLHGVVSGSDSSVKESIFLVFARILARCELKIRSFSEQKLLGFLQSCVLYLPTPDAAVDLTANGDRQDQRAANRSLQMQSEELRLHVLSCLQLLLSGKADDMRLTTAGAAANTEQIHFFAYFVSSLLHVGQHDKCRPVARLAVENLGRVMAFLHDAELLRQFFPGVSVGMWKTINAPQQTSNVVVAALQCLSASMKLCISDEFNQSTRDSTSFSIEALRALMKHQKSEKEVAAATGEEGDSEQSVRDQWLEETTVNVDIILSKLFGSQMYQRSWRVRRAMVELCGAVVLSARVTLKDSFFRCYEELLVLRVDDMRDVAVSAEAVIKTLQTELSVEEWLQMVPMFADRFQMHLSTLSLKSSTELESVSISLMRKLIGYVSFLGKRLGSHLDASMESMYSALCRIMEFDAIDIDLILHQKYKAGESAAGGSEDTLVASQFQKRLRFFHEEESVKVASQLLHAIGSVCTPALFIDCAFMLLYNEEVMGDRHAEVFLVLNGLLKAHVKKHRASAESERLPDAETLALLPADASDDDDAGVIDVHLVGRILEDLLLLEAWNEHNNDRMHRQRSPKKPDVAQRALMVECIGICVEILHKDFEVFLLHVLYPLVEKLGSQDVEVERAALTTLHKIYYFCGYASVEALFEANMDYFVDALCSRLEHLEEFPLTALVVEGLLRHTKIASLPLVDEVANSLLRSVDAYQDSPYIRSLLRALKLVLSSMTEDTRENAHQAPVRSGGAPLSMAEKPGSQLKQFIKEIRILSNESTFDDEADEEEEDRVQLVDEPPVSEGDEEQASMKGAMPVEYDERETMDGGDDADSSKPSEGSSIYTTLIIEILDRSGHFLSESDPIACCLVLSIIEEGVLLLRDSRKELLPLIHRIWSSILHRLAVTNKPILTATIRLLNTLARVAGDFIGDRFVENVWPTLRSHLRAIELRESTPQLTRSMLLLDTDDSPSAPSSTLEAEKRTRKSQEIQLLLASLACLVTVCSQSSAVTSVVPEVTTTCSKFLSAALPSEVVIATQTLFVALAELNGDEVFCALAPLANWVPPPPPRSRFPALTADATKLFYKAQLGARDSAVYRENATMLMNQLQRHH